MQCGLATKCETETARGLVVFHFGTRALGNYVQRLGQAQAAVRAAERYSGLQETSGWLYMHVM